MFVKSLNLATTLLNSVYNLATTLLNSVYNLWVCACVIVYDIVLVLILDDLYRILVFTCNFNDLYLLCLVSTSPHQPARVS